MAKANHKVDVFVEAVPFSDNYYQLSDAQKAHVNALLLIRLNELIPLDKQETWKDISAPNTDYDDVLVQINAQLMTELDPPVGTHLVLAQSNQVYWYKTELGHQIIFFAQLQDDTTGTISAWHFSVPFGTGVYEARVGLKYECRKV